MQIRIANIIRGTLIGNTMSVLTRYISRVVNGGGIVEKPQCVETALNSNNVLDSATFLLQPSGYKGGTLYAQKPVDGNGDLTWTRGSDAFRTNASGLIQRVPWNLVQRSEEFNNAIWSKVNSSILSDSTIAPNGTLTADKLIENTSAGFHRAFQVVSGFVGTTVTYSVYLKASERNWALVWFDGDIAGAYVNLSTGELGTVSSGVTASVTNVGDGWYRCIITRTIVSSANIAIFTATSNGGASYTGDGTSGIYIYGAQLVEGTTAQTYLPTTDRLNFPRLSYMYGSCPSALLEPQRTNLILQSDAFDNASWSKPVGWTVTANATTSPDGNTTADLITPTNFNNLSQAATVVSSTNYAISIYVKRNTTNSTWVSLIFSGGTSISYGYVINWSTLSISLIPVRTAATNPTFESVGNGWYRISFVCASGNNTSASLQVIPDAQAGTNSIYLYGAQLEAGAYPTTYIPTTSATATRIADSFSRNNIYTNGLISASGGTWFVELRNNIAYPDGAFTNFLFLANSTNFFTSTACFAITQFTTANERVSITKRVGSTTTQLYLTTTSTVKIAIKWNGTSADIFVNGTKVVSATSFTATNMENLIGGGDRSPMFIQQMALFSTPLSDTDCELLTGTSYSSYESMATSLGYYVI